MLVDSHAHIDVGDFDADRDFIVNECEILIVNAGVDLQSNLKTLKLARKYNNIIPAIGFHPEFVKDKINEVDKCVELTRYANIISEVGLDYFWIKENELKRKQIEILERFLQIAEIEEKPVIIHIRGGMKDFLEMITSFRKVKFIIHSFEGSIKIADKVIELGGLISIPPIIVRDKDRQRVVKEIPLDFILTETDSPFMGPEKMSRNKPCNVKFAIKQISQLKRVEEDEVEEKIYKNFLALVSSRLTTS
ncbi:TatD family hydrolase [Saccharolobus islandicus]|uniref:TatD-related deoxyribonuclease n=1 Tax=Saccharolobus islandicus (strain L.D.8.5 / Lassen \|nr:TatD family hydrolase [Sulfolobus islandicus]ADB87981.1 TatD-related deoxyribonuclease [Sulfolobus islandicus L.D.8.5]